MTTTNIFDKISKFYDNECTDALVIAPKSTGIKSFERIVSSNTESIVVDFVIEDNDFDSIYVHAVLAIFKDCYIYYMENKFFIISKKALNESDLIVLVNHYLEQTDFKINLDTSINQIFPTDRKGINWKKIREKILKKSTMVILKIKSIDNEIYDLDLNIARYEKYANEEKTKRAELIAEKDKLLGKLSDEERLIYEVEDE